MAKHLFRRMIVLFLVLGVLLSGVIVVPLTAMALSTTISNDATCATLEEYQEALEKICVSDHFIYYEDIAFIGEFAGFWGKDFDIYNYVRYDLKDASGATVTIGLNKLRYEVNNVFTLGQGRPIVPMPDRESFYHPPVDPVENPVNSVVYLWEDALYLYRSGEIAEDQSPIESICWTYGGYRINVSPGGSAYPEEAKDTLMGRLLDPDTAKDAMDQVNQAIAWRQFRVAVKKNAPVLICVGCVVLTGGAALLVRHKKKKQAAKNPGAEKKERRRVHCENTI